jgi:hypothetical protein
MGRDDEEGGGDEEHDVTCGDDDDDEDSLGLGSDAYSDGMVEILTFSFATSELADDLVVFSFFLLLLLLTFTFG